MVSMVGGRNLHEGEVRELARSARDVLTHQEGRDVVAREATEAFLWDWAE